MNMLRTASALALMALASPLALATSAPVQTSLSLTELSYSLSDLNAGDGVAPSLTTLPSSVFSQYVTTTSDYMDTTRQKWSGNVQGSSLDGSASTLTLDSGLATAVKQGNSQQVSTLLSSTAVNQIGDNGPASLVSGDCHLDGACRSYGQVKSYNDFVLGAYSKVVFSGNLQLNADVDTAALASLAYLSAHPGEQIKLTAQTKFSLYVTDGNYQQVGTSLDGQNAWFVSASNDLAHGSLTHSFQYEISNDSAQAMTVHFSGLASGQSTMTVSSAVPEPSSWALLGAGMVMVAALRQQRRRQG